MCILFLKSPSNLSCETSLARLVYMTELFESFCAVHTWYVTKVCTKSCSTFYADVYFFLLPQTLFIVSLCNNQLLYFMEKELIWIFGHIPGFSATLPSVIAKLHAAKDKYLSPPATASSSSQVEVGFFSSKLQICDVSSLTLPLIIHPRFSYWFLNAYNFTMYRTNSGISLLHLSGTL